MADSFGQGGGSTPPSYDNSANQDGMRKGSSGDVLKSDSPAKRKRRLRDRIKVDLKAGGHSEITPDGKEMTTIPLARSASEIQEMNRRFGKRRDASPNAQKGFYIHPSHLGTDYYKRLKKKKKKKKGRDGRSREKRDILFVPYGPDYVNAVLVDADEINPETGKKYGYFAPAGFVGTGVFGPGGADGR